MPKEKPNPRQIPFTERGKMRSLALNEKWQVGAGRRTHAASAPPRKNAVVVNHCVFLSVIPSRRSQQRDGRLPREDCHPRYIALRIFLHTTHVKCADLDLNAYCTYI